MVLIWARKTSLSCKESNNLNRAEGLGVICGALYLISLFLFIPFPFLKWFTDPMQQRLFPLFHIERLGQFTCALLSICCMIFLGFADDVLNLKWRYKLLLPAVSSLPMLMSYAAESGVTSVVVPYPLVSYLGSFVDLGIFYYFYMSMMTIFCVNSINILAGINGLEVGQVIVISFSIMVNNMISIYFYSDSLPVQNHLFSLFIIIPLFFVSLPLAYYNWYPANVFVGDTFCYFSGMTIAVAGVMGHFSKTLMLFLIPQTFNFLYSLPQLSRVFPCPRHRLPKYSESCDALQPSFFEIESPSPAQKILLKLMEVFLVAKVERSAKTYRVNNLTLLNLVLIHFGPMNEQNLTITILAIQSVCSLMAFLIRFKLVSLFYDS